MTSSDTKPSPSADAEKGLEAVRKPWATPRVIASVEARQAQSKHMFSISDSHSPGGGSASYS